MFDSSLYAGVMTEMSFFMGFRTLGPTSIG